MNEFDPHENAQREIELQRRLNHQRALLQFEYENKEKSARKKKTRSPEDEAERQEKIAEKRRVRELKKTKGGRFKLYKEKHEIKREKKEFRERVTRVDRFKRNLAAIGNFRLKNRKVIRATPRATIVVRPERPAPYVNRYFKAAYENERRNLFFK